MELFWCLKVAQSSQGTCPALILPKGPLFAWNPRRTLSVLFSSLDALSHTLILLGLNMPPLFGLALASCCAATPQVRRPQNITEAGR